MIEIAICDDEIEMASAVEDLVVALSSEQMLDINIDIFYDGSTLLQHIKEGNHYDLIYLDIEMKIKNGVDTAKELRLLNTKTLLIYVTGYESFAKDAFEVDAFRFLTKPIDRKKFESYFRAAIDKLQVRPEYFEYTFNRVNYRIPLDKIIYFQSDKRITYIVTEQEIIYCYERLNSIEKSLSEKNVYFYRIHQSLLINPHYVKKYQYSMLELLDGTEFTISEKRRKSVSEMVCRLKGDEIVGL